MASTAKDPEDTSSADAVVAALRDSLKETARLRRRNRELTDREREPVAIVGMACRYPGGVVSPEGLWDLVADGGDAITEFPEDRGWDVEGLYNPDREVPGSSYTRRGGFLHGAGGFDAEFFGISPREALAMDPQQRLLLEISWEALERAGIDPTSVRGSRTGVYAGVMYHDYGPHLHRPVPGVDGHRLTGTLGSVLSGRVSYAFGFEGPAVTVDTACSSSLVALHLAVSALRRGECDVALAGGVTVMSTPGTFVEFSRQGGLSADGRCRSFGAGADGTGWAEGAGVLLVERLSDARRLGHRVLAVVRGSAVNQDGASNGLTAPNGPSQQRVIRAALADADLKEGDVDAVEAHGTGTRLGDPIEADALLATYGQGRVAERPLWLGSLKSNLGHAQAAAGVGGVIKMVMAMRHGVLPRTLHAETPSPFVDWDAGAVELLAESREWPQTGRPRRAGVSSFGISGTNAHVLLEQAPEPEPRPEPEEAAPQDTPTMLPVPLSAASEAALRAQAVRLGEFLAADPSPSLTEVAHALATTRALMEHRAVILATDREELLTGLATLAAGEESPRVVTGQAGPGGGLAVVFTGQGSQRPGMGRELHHTFPVFRDALNETCALLDRELAAELADAGAGSLRDIMFAEPGTPQAEALDHTVFTQSALFAFETALYRLLSSWGIHPDHLAGHSVGEVVAAHTAGILTLPDACTLIAARGRLMNSLPTGGAMVSVQAPEERVAEVITAASTDGGGVEIAAVNGPASVVISGEKTAVLAIAGQLEEQGVKTRRLRVSHAFHSPLMDPILEDFHTVLDTLTFTPPRTPVISNLTGRIADPDDITTPDYWIRHARQAVRYADTLHTLDTLHTTTYLEVGPDTTLTTLGKAALPDLDTTLLVPTQHRTTPETTALLHATATLHTHNRSPLPPAPDSHSPTIDLPTYPFQHKHYWLPSDADTARAATGHPLLGLTMSLADSGSVVLSGRLSRDAHPWLADHAVLGTVLFPGTGLVELAIRAGAETGCAAVEELTLEAPLVLPATGGRQVQLVVAAPDADGRREVRIYSRPDADPADRALSGEDTFDVDAAEEWTRHATGVLAAEDTTLTEGTDLLAWPPSGADAVDLDGWYETLAGKGFEYGPAFQGLRAAWRRGDEIFADIALDETQAETAGRYGLHPALLDAALHAIELGALPATPGETHLPFAFNDVRLHATGAPAARIRLAPAGPGAVSLTVADVAGQPVAEIGSLSLRPADPAQFATAGASAPRDSLFTLGWVPVTATGTETVPAYADIADALAEASGSDAAAVRLTSAPGLETPGSVHELTHRALAAVQQWLAEERTAETLLVAVTHQAVAADVREDVRDPAGAAVWGLLRSAQTENPGRVVLVDLDEETAADPARQAAALAAAVASGEPQLAVRGGRLLAPRLHRAVPAASAPTVWDPEGTVLVTGATGALGALLARHLVAEHGVRRLLLTSRRGRQAPGADELAAELAGLGAEAVFAACDVSDPAAVAELLAAIPAAHPLRAVVHAAGVVDDGVVAALTPERLSGVLRPKADAAWHLHRATAQLDLKAFVLFSSVAGTYGTAGQASYAAGNAFLDALAAHRHAQGLPATSLAWGPWAEGGMAAELNAADQARLTRAGMRELTVAQGLALFDTALALDAPVALPVGLDTGALRALGDELPPLMRALVRVPARRAATAADATPLTQRLAGRTADEQREVLLELVRAQVAAVLDFDGAGSVEARRGFKELGIDSLTAVELRNRLGKAVGLRLPATLVFDHPSAAAVADYLVQELGTAQTSAEAPVRRPAAASVRGVDEPIAIVGMACRYPGGVRSPEDLWQLVTSRGDAISEFPADRGWDVANLFDPDPDRPGTSYTREGGFLHDVAEFDAEFFGISPREALAMDPQQRLLLETSWEAFERAGIDPATLRGSDTGVFTGLMYHDYVSRLPEMPGDLEGYLGTGNTGSVSSGRISYTFGLEGPAVSVDTACSSSLVALHLAIRALRSGECSLALAGGVTVLASPFTFIEFSRQRALSPTGRSRSFSADADGTGWAEGAGMLLVERLSDARRNGHRVLAVVRGTAVNQDGASNGLTAPNGPSQQRVIRAALADARLTPADVDAVEAHGTGTPLGDPIEAQALQATYGQERADADPLWLGSVKSNIGHTQAAAGAASVIKMVQALQHGVLPPTLHAETPSPFVDWDAGAVELLAEARDWPETGRVRRAGVSSFGISGTNAHVILEQAPEEQRARPDGPTEELPEPNAAALPLSAADPAALRDQARRLATHLSRNPGLRRTDVAHALATTRAALPQRAVVLGEGLDVLARGESAPNVITGTAREWGRTVFVLPGQGSQWRGMAVELLDSTPLFAERLRECAAVIERHVPWRVEAVLRGEPEAPPLERIEVLQPVLFAVNIALAALWQAHGIHPDAVIGHSQGEIAAAHISGALTLHDATRIVLIRSQLFADHLTGHGAVASLQTTEENALRHLAAYPDRLWIAGVNGPTAVTVAGDHDALEELVTTLTDQGVRARIVPSTVASHSPKVEPLRDRLLTALAFIQPRKAHLPHYSTATGAVLDGTELTPDYWYENCRRPVTFAPTIHTLLTTGHTTFIEISAHPVLTMAIEETAEAAGAEALVLGTLRRDEGGPERLNASLAEAWVRGLPVRWPEPARPRRVDLPTYPFQRKRYWVEAPADRSAAGTGDAVETGFWEAVENDDLETLAATLGLDDGDALGAVLPALSSWRRGRVARSAADAWRYKVAWRPVTEPASVLLSGTWLLVAPEGHAEAAELAGRVALALERHGARPVRLDVAATVDRAELALAIRESAAGETAGEAAGEVAGILSLLPLDETPSAGRPALTAGTAGTLLLMQALADTEVPVPLWTVTRGAVGTADADPPTAPVQAQVWALGRTAAVEHPDRWGGLVDLPAAPDDRDIARLVAALSGLADEDQLAVRGAGMLARRLVRSPLASVPVRRSWTPHGTVLVTGGTRGMGAHTARQLAALGAEHLLLTTDMDLDVSERVALEAEFTAVGARVTVAVCDVADRTALAALLASVPEDTPLTAVVHAAGELDAAALTDLDPAELEHSLRTRTLGAAHLDELLADTALEGFVLFSSIAGVWGSGAQGGYGAANAYVDALAAHRRARGLPATSVAWGPWADPGTGLEDEEAEAERRAQLRRRGLTPLPSEQTVAALIDALSRDETALVLADVDWERFAPAFTAVRSSPLLGELPEAVRVLTDSGPDDGGAAATTSEALTQTLAGLSASDQERVLTDLVRAETAVVLGHTDSEAVDGQRPLKDLGFDSLAAVTLRNRLGAATGLKLPATLVFNHPTPVAVAAFLRAELLPERPETSLDAELDRLQEVLAGSGLADDAAARDLVAARLRRLLDTVTDEASGAGARSEVEEQLASASDDDIFSFIDNELGQ
ncbi:SDR family NAD(P)-dependent oxidoreductase [Streptomyces sp. NBC_00075]|uniref:type I polyketide synthase n=1 Tax=Streptomyces sp. NBC_00075 TaxID=2975641 RepID=UPI0032460E9C